MMPGNALSTHAKTGHFLVPDDRRPRLTKKAGDETSYGQCLDSNPTDWDLGGLALNDPSHGLKLQVWEFRLEGETVVAQPADHGETVVLHAAAGPGITELAGAFDSNMQYVLAFVQGGVTKLYWYDSTPQEYVTTEFPGCDSPRLTLDDKRESQADSRDVLFFYLRANALYFRVQREKYATEHHLQDCPPRTLRLGRVGMNTVNRVQIEFLCAG